MSRCNWMLKLALGGWLAAFLLAPVLAQEPQSPEATAKPDTRATEQQPQPIPSPTPPAPTINAAKDQESGGNSDYYPREDLKAQRQMAVATEGLVDLTDTQVNLISIEIGLVLIAIGAAFWAAWEARKAAKSTAETVTITRETAERQLRAYVTTEESVWKNTGDNWCFQHSWHNTGPTPALKALTHVNWEAMDGEIPDDFDYPDTGLFPGNEPTVIGPQHRLMSWPIFIPYGVVDDIDKRLYIWGWVEYEGIFEVVLLCWTVWQRS